MQARKLVIRILILVLVIFSALSLRNWYDSFLRYKDFSLKMPKGFNPLLSSESIYDECAYFVDQKSKSIISITHRDTNLSIDAIGEELLDKLTKEAEGVKRSELFDVTTNRGNRLFYRKSKDSNGEYWEIAGAYYGNWDGIYLIQFNIPADIDEQVLLDILTALENK